MKVEESREDVERERKRRGHEVERDGLWRRVEKWMEETEKGWRVEEKGEEVGTGGRGNR